MNHLFAPVIFGLAASLCWDSGDFSGGLASRRANVGSVVLTDYTVGLILLVTLALIGKEPVPAPADLARGKMGSAVPVSAVLTAALPVLFSAFAAGLTTLLQLSGFALAGLSIGLISWPQRTTEPPEGITLAVLVGVAFAASSSLSAGCIPPPPSGRWLQHAVFHRCVAPGDATAAQASAASNDRHTPRWCQLGSWMPLAMSCSCSLPTAIVSISPPLFLLSTL
jgi:hypothetical protein